jgi:hypothetical protein
MKPQMEKDDDVNVAFVVARTRNNAVPLVQQLATAFGKFGQYVSYAIHAPVDYNTCACIPLGAVQWNHGEFLWQSRAHFPPCHPFEQSLQESP